MTETKPDPLDYLANSNTGVSAANFKNGYISNYKYKCRADGCRRDFRRLIDREEHVRLAHPEMNNPESSLVDRHIGIPCGNCELSLGYVRFFSDELSTDRSYWKKYKINPKMTTTFPFL